MYCFECEITHAWIACHREPLAQSVLATISSLLSALPLRHASRVMKKCTSHWYCQSNEKRILLEIDTLNKKIWLYSPPKRMRSWHELMEPIGSSSKGCNYILIHGNRNSKILQNILPMMWINHEKSPSLFTWVI